MADELNDASESTAAIRDGLGEGGYLQNIHYGSRNSFDIDWQKNLKANDADQVPPAEADQSTTPKSELPTAQSQEFELGRADPAPLGYTRSNSSDASPEPLFIQDTKQKEVEAFDPNQIDRDAGGSRRTLCGRWPHDPGWAACWRRQPQPLHVQLPQGV